MAPKVKEFQEYLAQPTASHVGHADYIKSPASAFLRYTIEAKDAINLCLGRFPKSKGSAAYTKDAQDSLQHLTAAVLPAIMGHFETYQRYLFAGMFENSSHLKGFDVRVFFQNIQKQTTLELDPKALSAYRGMGVSPIGVLLADSLSGWHSPTQVNSLFAAFGFGKAVALFSPECCKRLAVLWQLRHSIVHTGGTLTHPDAQKVEGLIDRGGQKVVFQDRIITEVSRRLHKLVQSSTLRMATPYKARLSANLDTSILARIDQLFLVRSSYPAWLR